MNQSQPNPLLFILNSVQKQLENDSSWFAKVNKSLEKLSSVSFDGKTSFENEIKTMQDVKNTLFQIGTKYQILIGQVIKRKSDRFNKREQKKKAIQKIQNQKNDLNKVIQNLKDQKENAINAFDDALKMFEKVYLKCMENKYDLGSQLDQDTLSQEYQRLNQKRRQIIQPHKKQAWKPQESHKSSHCENDILFPTMEREEDRLRRQQIQAKRTQRQQGMFKLLSHFHIFEKLKLNNMTQIQDGNPNQAVLYMKQFKQMLRQIQMTKKSLQKIKQEQMQKQDDPQSPFEVPIKTQNIRNNLSSNNHQGFKRPRSLQLKAAGKK